MILICGIINHLGIEYVRGNGVNIDSSVFPFNLEDVAKDFVELLYNGIREISGEKDPKVQLNLVAEGKASILLSLLHVCMKLPAEGSPDRQYYASFSQFNTNFCKIFYTDSDTGNDDTRNKTKKDSKGNSTSSNKDSMNKKNSGSDSVDPSANLVSSTPSAQFAWVKANWGKAVALNPFAGAESWNNHSLILLLNGIFDQSKLFPLNRKLLETQTLLSTPNQKFFQVEDEYLDFVAENTGIKYSTEHLGSRFNSFFDDYRFSSFYKLMNDNFDFRKFYSLSKKLDVKSGENVRFYLDEDVYKFNVDNYYLAGLLDGFYVFVADGSFKSCLHYLSSRFGKYSQVFKINFDFIKMVEGSNDFPTLNEASYKKILDSIIKGT